VLSLGLGAVLPSAVRVRIRSRSTSASPPSTASIKRPVLLVLSAHGSAKGQGSELRLGVHDALDDGEQIEGAAREAVDARHCHHVAGGGCLSILRSSRQSVISDGGSNRSRGGYDRGVRLRLAGPARFARG
jgi:hypothetical protein